MVRPHRAIILAAGSGSRLWPHTEDLPKTLLKVGNMTIFDRIAHSLQQVGIKEIVVVSGHANSSLESHISNHTTRLINDQIDFKIIKNEHLELGNLFTMWLARNEMKEDFLLFDSDVVFHHDILNQVMSSQHDSEIVVDDSKQVLSQDQSKVTISDSKYVKDIGKTIDTLYADGEYVGIMKISATAAKRVLNIVHELLAAPLFPQYYTYPFRLVAKEVNCFFARSTQGLPWIEVDTARDLNYANELVLPFVEKSKSGIIELNSSQ